MIRRGKRINLLHDKRISYHKKKKKRRKKLWNYGFKIKILNILKVELGQLMIKNEIENIFDNFKFYYLGQKSSFTLGKCSFRHKIYKENIDNKIK